MIGTRLCVMIETKAVLMSVMIYGLLFNELFALTIIIFIILMGCNAFGEAHLLMKMNRCIQRILEAANSVCSQSELYTISINSYR